MFHWNIVVGAGDDDVGLDADAAQFTTLCCVGLVFSSRLAPM
jgi:hypothetical protein